MCLLGSRHKATQGTNKYRNHRSIEWSLVKLPSGLKSPVVFSTDRSKAVVPVLVLLCCFVVYSTRRFVLYLAFFILFLFFSPSCIAITSLGEERASLGVVFFCCFFFCAFVRFALVWFCPFPLPLGDWDGLRFVIVALPGLFSYPPFF